MTETVRWMGRGFKGNARQVYEEIQTLGDSYTPDDIVELAKDPQTELHKCFEWDDTLAAEHWRRFTAKQICCSLKIVIEYENKEPTTYRLIQHDDEEKAYKPVVFTVRHEDDYARLLRQAKEELAAFKKRYKGIVELKQVIDDIDEILNN